MKVDVYVILEADLLQNTKYTLLVKGDKSLCKMQHFHCIEIREN